MMTNFIPEQAFLFRSIYDVMTPENQGQLIRTYPSIKIPSMMGQQSRMVDGLMGNMNQRGKKDPY